MKLSLVSNAFFIFSMINSLYLNDTLLKPICIEQLKYSGYMTPEYAMEGRFSEKSDIFSFGVLLLEIVSGKKNTSFHDDDSMTLLGFVSTFNLPFLK